MDLVKSISIENLVALRNGMASKIEEAHKLLQEAKEIAEVVNDQIEASTAMHPVDKLKIEYICFDYYTRHNIAEEEGAPVAISKMDAVLWDLLLKESGLMSVMDEQARQAWRKQVEEGEHPELTKENIQATFEGLNGAKENMFERGVLNIFEKLSWNYKTNSPVKFGKKIIFTYGCEPSYNAGTGYLGYQTKDKLADLARVFAVMDGKPEPDHREQFPSQIDLPGKLHTEYFELRFFKKGSLHVIFERPDLVDDLNRILAKHYPDALPPKG